MRTQSEDPLHALITANVTLNARFELVQELDEYASVALSMLTFPQFLERLEALVGTNFAESTFAEAEAVPDDQSTPDDDAAPTWLVEQLAMLVDRLRQQDSTGQADVIHAAATAGEGRLTRAEVFGILGRSENDKLTGFTRVVITVQCQMENEGLLPPGLAPALVAEYDGPVKAQRFAVPRELAGTANHLAF